MNPMPVAGVCIGLLFLCFSLVGKAGSCSFPSQVKSLLPPGLQFLASKNVASYDKEKIRKAIGVPSRKVVDSWYYDFLGESENLLLTFESENDLSFYRFRFDSDHASLSSLKKSDKCWREILHNDRQVIVPKLGVSQGKFIEVAQRIKVHGQERGEWKILFRNNLDEPLYSVEWRK